MNWSSGKDASFALYKLLQDPNYSVNTLFTSINKKYQRVSMHGLSVDLLKAQAKSIGLPLEIIELSEHATMEEYNNLMNGKMDEFLNNGYSHSAFGDIFLEDLKEYRVKMLQQKGLTGVFPLWKKNTKDLLKEFLNLGFKTIVVCINGNKLPKEFCGRIIDLDFIEQLPENIDPCGENGEFHTFCFDGPIFEEPIRFNLGEKVYKSYPNPQNPKEEFGFWFQDIQLKS